MDFRFNLSVSTSPYDRNEDERKTGYLQWKETTTTIDGLQYYILHNYAFCHCFNHYGSTFANSQKTQKNLKAANMVMLDLDAVKYNVHDFWKLMQETEIAPNLVYSTRNDGHYKTIEDKYPNRYRCVYVIDKSIDNYAFYSALVNAIKSEIAIYCEDNEVFNDTTDADCSHFFAGNIDATSYVNANAYALDFFIKRYDLGCPDSYIIKRERGEVIKKGTGHFLKEKKEFNNKAFGNAWQSDSDDIRLLYDFNEYHTYTTTQIEWNDDELYRYVDDIYVYDLKRRWRKRKDPITDKEYTTIIRYKYGEHRKRKIWSALLIRRLIDPTITLEHLCYAAVYELYNFIDNTNSEHYITRKHLKHIAEEILQCDLDKYKDKYRNKKLYMINKMERIKRGLTVTEVMKMANSELKQKEYLELAKNYDPDKSVRKNAEILGISKTKCSELKKWLTERQNDEAEQLPTNEEKNRQNASKYPQIENEAGMDMCCEDMIRDMYRIIKNTFEPEVMKPDKMDLSWMKKTMKHLVNSKP